MKKIYLIFFLVLSSCMSPYQKSGLGGGYTDMALSNDMYFVTFRGNGYTPSEVVQSYVLRRAAEIALNKGYKYFLIINGGTEKSNQIIQTPTTVQTHSFSTLNGTSFSGNTMGFANTNSYSTITPGSQVEFHRYKTGAIIKLLHSKANYPTALDAKIILENFKTKQ